MCIVPIVRRPANYMTLMARRRRMLTKKQKDKTAMRNGRRQNGQSTWVMNWSLDVVLFNLSQQHKQTSNRSSLISISAAAVTSQREADRWSAAKRDADTNCGRWSQRFARGPTAVMQRRSGLVWCKYRPVEHGQIPNKHFGILWNCTVSSKIKTSSIIRHENTHLLFSTFRSNTLQN